MLTVIWLIAVVIGFFALAYVNAAGWLWTAAIEEESTTAAHHGFALGAGRPGEAETRSEVVRDVVKVVLPVVAHSDRDRQI